MVVSTKFGGFSISYGGSESILGFCGDGKLGGLMVVDPLASYRICRIVTYSPTDSIQKLRLSLYEWTGQFTLK